VGRYLICIYVSSGHVQDIIYPLNLVAVAVVEVRRLPLSLSSIRLFDSHTPDWNRGVPCPLSLLQEMHIANSLDSTKYESITLAGHDGPPITCALLLKHGCPAALGSEVGSLHIAGDSIEYSIECMGGSGGRRT